MARPTHRRNAQYAKLIRERRIRKGLTQAGLAHDLGYNDKSPIYRIENLHIVPFDVRIRRRLEKLLDIKPGHSRRILREASPNLSFYSEAANSVALEDTLEVYRVIDIEEIEFRQFQNLIKAAFPDPDTRASDKDLERWLDDAESYLFSPVPCDNIYLVAKPVDRNVIVGLLFASHYSAAGFMFIDYMVVDIALADDIRKQDNPNLADEIKSNAARLLLETLAEMTPKVKGVFTEVASAEVGLKATFGKYARQFVGVGLYALGINYKAPDVDVEKDGTDIQYDLLYFPGLSERSNIDVDNPGVTRQKALEILSFIYNQAYGDSDLSTSTEDEYRGYSGRLFEKVSKELPDWVPLVPIRS